MTRVSLFCVSLIFSFLSGSASAQSRPAVTSASLQQLLDQSWYLEFAEQLGMAPGLTTEEHEYFLGVLAFHVGRFDEATKPLIAAVNTHNTSLTPEQVEQGLETLGECAEKQSQYGASAQMYDVIGKTWGARMADGGAGVKEKRHVAALLQHVPPQTIAFSGDFRLQRTGLEYPVSVGGKTFPAQFDTGAEISVLSASTAKSWGATMLDGTATLHGYGGGTFTAQPGFLPVLTIGSAELHNVAVYVTADENLYIAPIKRQTHALLGFPVVSALGRLTFAKDGTLSVSAQSPAADPKTSVHLWFGGHALLIPLGTMPMSDSKGQATSVAAPRLFMLDTGSESSFLTDHYLAEHISAFPGAPKEMARLAGGGGVHEIPAYKAHGERLLVGESMLTVNGPHVLTQPQGGEAENYYGVIGQDLLQLFSSYTVDFRTRAFSVQP